MGLFHSMLFSLDSKMTTGNMYIEWEGLVFGKDAGSVGECAL